MIRFAVLIALIVAAVFGCEHEPAQRSAVAQTSGQPRIVSLSPAISRTIVDLNLGDLIVGRTPYCHSVSRDVPVVGDLENLNYEHLIRLNPTHVLVQPASGTTDPHLQELSKRHGWIVRNWTLNDIEDIRELVQALPDLIFAEGEEQRLVASTRAEQIARDMADQLNPADDEQLFRGRVLLLAAADPPMAFADQTYLDDVLDGIGVPNAARGVGWVTFTFEDVVRLNPEAIILVRDAPPSDEDAHSKSMQLLRSLQVDAARHGRVAEFVHPDVMLPSSALRHVAAELRRVLKSFADEPR